MKISCLLIINFEFRYKEEFIDNMELEISNI